MNIILQRTKRKKTEYGYVLNESPETLSLCMNFPKNIKEKSCACTGTRCNCYVKHLATIPLQKYYSSCEVKNNNCIPGDALTYNEGKYIKSNCCVRCR